jgi:hypothetical protein
MGRCRSALHRAGVVMMVDTEIPSDLESSAPSQLLLLENRNHSQILNHVLLITALSLIPIS